MQYEVDRKQLCSFGLIVGGVFAGIGVWPLVIRFAEPRWWALIVAAVLILPAMTHPQSLYWPHKGWMMLGHVLGWINTRIILGLVFYAVVTPTGLIRRLLGKDPMGRRTRPELDTYRVIRKPRPGSDLAKQY
jgi:hypothetical protein